MKRLSIAFACVAALALFVGSAHADADQSADYAAPGGASVLGGGVAVTGTILGNNIGRVSFAPNGEIPVSVGVADKSGGPVLVVVGQDTDENGFLGDAGEPTLSTCGNEVDLTTSAVPFDPTKDVVVDVSAGTYGACAAVSLGGTVTLHTITPPAN